MCKFPWHHVQDFLPFLSIFINCYVFSNVMDNRVSEDTKINSGGLIILSMLCFRINEFFLKIHNNYNSLNEKGY